MSLQYFLLGQKTNKMLTKRTGKYHTNPRNTLKGSHWQNLGHLHKKNEGTKES